MESKVKKYKKFRVLLVFIICFLVFLGICKILPATNVVPSKSSSNSPSSWDTATAVKSPPSTSFNFSEKNKLIVVKLTGDVNVGWANKIEKEFKKSDCIGIIGWIESFGGAVDETKLTLHKIEILKKKYHKDFIVYSEKNLFSGAYWIACAASKIVVAPSGEAGSIGVFTLRVDETVSDSVAGIKYNLIKSGKNKGMLFSHNKMTDGERSILQDQIDILYREFIQYIFDCRYNQLSQAYEEIYKQTPNGKKVMNFLKTISDGRNYSATDALWFGLVDNVMYFDELVGRFYKNISGIDIITTDGKNIEDFYPEEDSVSIKVKEKK